MNKISDCVTVRNDWDGRRTIQKLLVDGMEYEINNNTELTDKFQWETDELRGKIYSDRYELENQITEIMKRLNRTVSLVHNCANCGATLNIEENKPVFHCKYCGSTYLIGTTQIYSTY